MTLLINSFNGWEICMFALGEGGVISIFFRTTNFLFICFVWQCVMLRKIPSSFYLNVVLLLSASSTEWSVEEVAILVPLIIFLTIRFFTVSTPVPYFYFNTLMLFITKFNRNIRWSSSWFYFWISLNSSCCFFHFRRRSKADDNSRF